MVIILCSEDGSRFVQILKCHKRTVNLGIYVNSLDYKDSKLISIKLLLQYH